MDKLYLNNHWSDVTCYVGANKHTAVKFPAHKCVLTLVSPVFATMLGNNDFEESKSGEILFTDVTESAFNSLLFFAYTGGLTNHTVEKLSDTLFIANKYLVDDLTNLCIQQLARKTITTDNFWTFFTILQNHFSEQIPADLVLGIISFLFNNEKELLEHDDFESLPLSSINALVEIDSLNKNLTELDLLNHVLDWSKLECCRQQLDITPVNQRLVLGDVIYKIRFLALERDDLRSVSKILTVEETNMLLDRQVNKSAHIHGPFSEHLQLQPRQSDQLLTRNKNYLLRNTQSNPTARNHGSFIVVSAVNFIFQSVGMFITSSDQQPDILCEVSYLRGGLVKAWSYSKLLSPDNYVTIRKSICLKAFTPYKFSVYFSNAELYSERFHSTVFTNGSQEALCIGGYSEDIDEEFKTTGFWRQNFGNLRNSHYLKLFDSLVILRFEVVFLS